MELYKIIANCANDASTYQLAYIPENFKGVKITQKFNWQNPVGYTPTFSLETMKIIVADKVWLDAIFDLYGLQSVVTFDIYKLNSTATAYGTAITFSVDFESYSKHDFYSEFALKSVSCLDDYNQTKNTARNFTGATMLALPTTQMFINYISLKKDDGISNGDNTGYLNLVENENSKIYNGDSALYGNQKNAYEFESGTTGTVDIAIKAATNLNVTFASSSSATVTVNLYRNDYTDLILQLATKTFVGNSTTILAELEKTRLEDVAFNDGDIFFIGVVTSDAGQVITGIYGGFSLEMYVSTVKDANEYGRKVPYLTAETVLNELFDDKATIETALKAYAVTASQSIIKKLSYISIIPKDFLTDFCLLTGSLINFKNAGGVEVKKISTFFSGLLLKANAIAVTSPKDVVISADTTLNYSGVSVGMEQKEYQVLTYFENWNKILTFIQSDRVASEVLNLALTKYRCDYSGLLDYINKMSPSSTDASTDMFIFDPAFTGRATSEGTIYDVFTPRDVLENWRKFLEVCFYNFGLDTLVESSSSGDDYNLQVAGVNQFDDFVFSGTDPKILPLKIEFTGLIPATDFTEKILTINHNSTDLYIFVTEAQTTDNLSEQKITGNLIYFTT